MKKIWALMFFVLFWLSTSLQGVTAYTNFAFVDLGSNTFKITFDSDAAPNGGNIHLAKTLPVESNTCNSFSVANTGSNHYESSTITNPSGGGTCGQYDPTFYYNVFVGGASNRSADQTYNFPTATPTPTYTITSTHTATPTASPTRTRSPTPSITVTFTKSPTMTATPTYTNSPTPTYSFTKTFSSTRTNTPTTSPTPTAEPGTLSFNYDMAGQVYVTWPGTNISGGNGSTVYVPYGNADGVYNRQADGGFDPMAGVFFATVPRGAPFHAKGVIKNQQGTFDTVDGFAYGPYTLTITPTNSPTRTSTPVVSATPTATPTITRTFTPVPVFTNVATITTTPGQVYISWQASNINVSPVLDVYVKYGSTTNYGRIAGGGYIEDTATFFAIVPQGGPFHFKCVVQNRQGVNMSTDFTVP